MSQTNHGSIEFLKFPNPQYPGDRTKLIKKWLRDSWARRKIAELQQAIADIVVPTKTSQLTNDSGFITQADVPPGSTASSTTPKMDGTASVGTETAFARGDHRHPTDTSRQAALSSAQMAAVNSGITSAKVAAYDAIEVPTKTSDLVNDSGFIAGYTETDPTVPAWAKASTKPIYTASEVGALPDTTEIPSKTSDLTNDSGFITSSSVPSAYTSNPQMDGTASAGSSAAWARGDHRHPTDTSRQAALSSTQLAAVNSGVTAAKVQEWDAIEVPTKTSELTNDSGFITSVPVQSVNGKTGTVNLDAADVGALPDSTVVPSKTSDLTNDSGFLTSIPGTIIYYGECTTAAAEQTKVVVCPGFSLVEGAVIVVRFTSAQNYSPSTNVNVLMNVNGTGAKQVKRAGTTNLPRYFWAPGQIVPFAYDGTNWVMVSGGIATTTYYGITRLTESLTSTATTLALSASAGKSLQDQIDALSDRITALGG